MVLNHHSCREQFLWDRPRKLKYLSLSDPYYRLLNTSYIFTYNRWIYCQCDKFQGCRTNPINGMISNINYCCVCSVELLITKKKFEI